MVLTLATTAAAGSSLSCLFSGSAAATTITAIPAAVTATTTAQTTALAAKTKEPNKKISYGQFGRADPPQRVGLIPFSGRGIFYLTGYLFFVQFVCF